MYCTNVVVLQQPLGLVLQQVEVPPGTNGEEPAPRVDLLAQEVPGAVGDCGQRESGQHVGRGELFLLALAGRQGDLSWPFKGEREGLPRRTLLAEACRHVYNRRDDSFKKMLLARKKPPPDKIP